MAWTAEDEAELRRLEAMERELDVTDEGYEAAEQIVQTRSKPVEPSGFSPQRAFLTGPVKDIVQNALDFVEDLGKGVQAARGTLRQTLGPSVSGALENVVPFGSSGLSVVEGAGEVAGTVTLPKLKGEDEAGAAERTVRSITGYLLPYAGWAKAFGVMKGASWLGRAGRGLAAGAATDITAQDPIEANLANTLRDTFGIQSDVLDALANEEDDERLLARFKAAATNLPLGIAAEGLFELGARTVRAWRGIKGEAEEARAILETMDQDFSIAVRPVADEAGEAGAKGAGRSAGQSGPAGEFDASIHVSTEPPPENFEDVLTFLQRQADLPDPDGTLFSRFAANLLQGNPEDALAKIGIDPVKLDYSQFDDPAMLGRLQRGLAEVYEGIATRLGRSNQVVSEATIVASARALASDATVLKELFGNTSNLAETLMGARLLVGSHAHKMLARANAALEAIKRGEGAAEWVAFLEDFHRHAYYLGAVRGAGSEIGRALRSLKFIAKVSKSTAKGLADDIAKKSHAGDFNAKLAADEQLNSVLMIESDAEKIALLNTLIDKAGDVGELAQFVRQKDGSLLKRLDAATKETLGNLFSSGTAAFNVSSGLTFMGLRGLGRWLSAAARLALVPFGAHQRVAARVALADAWAYTDGLVSAWGDAVRNTLAVLEREGASELFVNADHLGLKGLAKKAAEWQVKGRRAQGINFERVDLDARPRSLAMNPADRRMLDEMIESYDLPKLLEGGLKWFARSAGTLVNAAGTISRAGTILFINAPDQLIGTVAARAGAQAYAVREAAKQAAELGLEGKQLSTFLKARVAALTSDIDGWHDKGFEMGFREAAAAAGEHEAREILFQDALEFKATRAMGRAHHEVSFAHLPIAFLHTPLRIIERTAIDYTPLGLLKDRVRRAIIAGGEQREQALSQIGLGIFAMWTAYRLAEDRGIVGNDNGYTSSARLDRESYSLKIGADVLEFARLDPIGSLLGMGADIRAYIDSQQGDPEANSGIMQMFEAAVWATFSNLLSKSWLTSVSELATLAGLDSDDSFNTRLRNYVKGYGSRVVPGAGLQKSAERAFDPFERAALTFHEQTLKASVGASALPIQRDHLLGRPIPHNQGEVFTGLTWQPESNDPLLKELTALSFKVPRAKRVIEGVRLNGQQFNRWLELKGQVVRADEFGGLTMEEALHELIEMPEYKALRREARAEEIRKVMREYSSLATEALFEEDPELHKRVVAKQTFDDGRKAGWTQEQIDAETQAFARELGLIE